jgi:U3 small nucleolar RNA-associated protein 20
MVTVIGNSLYSTNAQVISAALKAMAHIVKCPLKSIDKSMPVYMKQTMDIIKGAGSTEAETTQVAFKSLATMLRDSQTAQIKEKDLTYLLELLSPDLEEPSRQASAFALLRAIVARKFIVPEIYDMMDNVSQIMVTSQSTQVQELCRSALLQFLLDYPQGKGRLNQQITFLVKNLTYVYESGRMSVMELLSACISKFHDNIIQEYAEMLFIALVMVVANDDSSKCREMAAQLIKNLLTRMPEAQRNSVLSHAHTWATQEGNAALARVSSQVYGLALDALKSDILAHQQILLGDVNSQILKCAEADLDDIDEGDSQLEWQIPYQSLNTLAKVLQVFPDVTTEMERINWSGIVELLVYPHAWVRSAASRLLGTLYSVSTIGVPNEKFKDESPLSLNGMKRVAGQLAVQLKSENLDNAMSIQAIKNLLWIGKCFYEIPHATVDSPDGEELSDHSDDGETDEAPPTGDHPLPWLFSKLSYQARSALIARRSKHMNKVSLSELQN